jgi:hypothetical protein
VANRFLLMGLIVLVSCGPLWADGLKVASASGSVGATCLINSGNGGFIDNFKTVTSSANISCDHTDTVTIPNAPWPPIQGSWHAAGGAVVTFGEIPMADVTGRFSTTGGFLQGSSNYVRSDAEVDYFLGIDQIVVPPQQVASIPVIMTVRGNISVQGGSGAGTAEAFAWFGQDGQGTNYYPGATVILNLTPDSVYEAIDYATCTANGLWGDVRFSVESDCQAVIDPEFQFDQAAFDAQMGSNTFPLAKYYDFGYSPNLSSAPTPTPEPSSFVLLGTGMLILLGLAARR